MVWGSLLKYSRFSLSLLIMYGLSISFYWAVIHPIPFLENRPVNIAMDTPRAITIYPKVNIISGVPVRIVIPNPYALVDLPIDPGYYDKNTDSWTLSGYRAQYAIYSSPANNYEGQTFIYGHNNDYVFGALRHDTPNAGDTATIYTSNGHIFEYSFLKAENLSPTDTNILNYSGPPILTIQTCTGSLNEWRTMYIYNFSKVIQ